MDYIWQIQMRGKMEIMKIKDSQLSYLEEIKEVKIPKAKRENGNGKANKIFDEDRAIHDWYRFVLSYPPHLVRNYIGEFGLTDKNVILDPFCGTGTTNVEAKLLGVSSVGIEAHPFSHFAASVKVDWKVNPDQLLAASQEIANTALKSLKRQGIEDNQLLNAAPTKIKLRTLSPDANDLILTNSISPLPLHKVFVLMDCLKTHENETYYRHALLALANALVFKISNLYFGPEVGVRKPKIDVPVVANWLTEIEKMANDLKTLQGKAYTPAKIHLADARQIANVLTENSIDAVITSPPYPNEKDYTRTTRLESVLLGFIKSKGELRELKKTMVRSNTRGVYKGDDDDKWISEHSEILKIADAIERRRVELNKDSGFERLYSRVTKLYFGGMARHLNDLKGVLRPGAQLAYVVGDQASYLRVKIQTGQLLAEIATALGYDVEKIDLFRTRLATATKEQLREEVVILHWKGNKEAK